MKTLRAISISAAAIVAVTVTAVHPAKAAILPGAFVIGGKAVAVFIKSYKAAQFFGAAELGERIGVRIYQITH